MWQHRQFVWAPKSAHMFLFYKMHWLPVCFWVQFKVVVMIEAYMAWGCANEGSVIAWLYPPSHRDQQERHFMGPIYKTVSSLWTQEESTFCHGAHLMEHHSPGTQIGPNNLSFRKALKSIDMLGGLAMVACWAYVRMGLLLIIIIFVLELLLISFTCLYTVLVCF